MMKKHLDLFAALAFVAAGVCTVHVQGTGFTYQGCLTSGTNGATGSYDLTIYEINMRKAPR